MLTANISQGLPGWTWPALAADAGEGYNGAWLRGVKVPQASTISQGEEGQKAPGPFACSIQAAASVWTGVERSEVQRDWCELGSWRFMQKERELSKEQGHQQCCMLRAVWTRSEELISAMVVIQGSTAHLLVVLRHSVYLGRPEIPPLIFKYPTDKALRQTLRSQEFNSLTLWGRTPLWVKQIAREQ